MSGIETGAQWRTKGDLARWIAQRAGVDPSEVEAAHRARTEARGEVWRSDDELNRVRKKAFARLRTTTTSSSASRATPTTGTAATSASERAARFTGRVGR